VVFPLQRRHGLLATQDTTAPITLRPYHSSHRLFVHVVIGPSAPRRAWAFQRGKKELDRFPFFLAVLWSASVAALGLHIPQSFPIFAVSIGAHNITSLFLDISGMYGAFAFIIGFFSFGRFWHGYLGCMTSPLPLSLC
jgi:hypothetical protein